MKKTFKYQSLILILMAWIGSSFLFQSCETESAYERMKAENPLLREVVVTDVVQTNMYTYLQFKEEQDSYWAAVSRREDIRKGDVCYFDNYMEMKNFQSKELDRTFESIYFIEKLSDQPFATAQPVMPEKTGSPDVPDLEIEGVEPVEGGTTIAELFNNRQAYGGQVIKVKGIVVKYSEAIMKKNWVHIQDGTRDQGEFDLAITTSDECALGDEVVFEGMITLDKDFGYGYSYDVIMEDAKLVEVKKATTLQ